MNSMREIDLETRLAMLETEEDVRESSTVTARPATADKIDDLVALFTDEAAMCNPAGLHTGREAIRAYYTRDGDSKIAFRGNVFPAQRHRGHDVLEAGWVRGFQPGGVPVKAA
jgi:hypothetical protein